jgi:putative tricarboxylic transport membrane protein
MKRIGWLSLVVPVLVGLLAAPQAPAAAAWEPKGRIECIAPANPGGGWDSICRTVALVLQKSGITKETMYVSNMPGGSGAVAIANVVARRKGDTNLLVAASNSLTFTIAMKRTPHTYNDVIPLAQIGTEIGGFFVMPDSKFKTLADLVNALKKDPKAATFAGGSAPGGLDHIKAAIFAKTIGVGPTKLSYVPFQGGGEALTSLLGGHTDVAALDLSEAAGQLEAGKIRVLALLAEKRSSKYKDAPTTYEQGVKASLPVWRGLYMAPGVPAEAVRFWSDAIQKMVKTKDWDTNRERLGWEPAYKFGNDFGKFVKDETISMQALLKELGFLN